jgi:hypothetical protein
VDDGVGLQVSGVVGHAAGIAVVPVEGAVGTVDGRHLLTDLGDPHDEHALKPLFLQLPFHCVFVSKVRVAEDLVAGNGLGAGQLRSDGVLRHSPQAGVLV